MVGVGSAEHGEWGTSVATLCHDMKTSGGDVGLRASQEAQHAFAAVELEILADMKRSGTSEQDARKKASAGGTRSRKAAARKKKQSDTVDKNPDLANDMADGDIGEEQLDAIANASEKSNGEAATDDELIDKIKNAAPDDANSIASRWLEARNEDGTKTRHERQRARRSVRFGYDPASGCESVTATGDNESMREIQRQVKQRADELYRKDGGRDLASHLHPRTHTQRMYDAFHQILTGASAGDGSSSGDGVSSVRNMMHVFVTVDDKDANLIRAHMPNGDGYLPESIVEKYCCNTMMSGTVFSQSGEVLFYGRQRRSATPAQVAAMIARDRGCVMCSADVSRCEAHHLNPYHSEKQGETNVEDMALACVDCHHWLHAELMTLYWQLGPSDPATGVRNRIWQTRPATPDEIARGEPWQRTNQSSERRAA